MTTNGFKISIRPVITKAFKYGKYNPLEEPIYNVTLQAITNIDMTADCQDPAAT